MKDLWSMQCKFYTITENISSNCVPCLMFNPLSDWIMRDGKSVSSSASVLLIWHILEVTKFSAKKMKMCLIGIEFSNKILLKKNRDLVGQTIYKYANFEKIWCHLLISPLLLSVKENQNIKSRSIFFQRDLWLIKHSVHLTHFDIMK